jgi:SNF2 family DNA or RNA helicase
LYPPFNVVVYKGPPADRKNIERKYFTKNSNINIIITSYEFAHKDKTALSKNEYSFVIIDEAHKIKNHSGKLSQSLSQLKSKNGLLFRGTPLQNNPRELWFFLNFLLPSVLVIIIDLKNGSHPLLKIQMKKFN